jgi:hypothetical protein
MSETEGLTLHRPGSSIRSRRRKRHDLWLGTKVSAHTRRAYRAEIDRFRTPAAKPLGWITMTDLQSCAQVLGQV